jgi:division protein CdvB (Snf7/Vps24/ESCRT-III family)
MADTKTARIQLRVDRDRWARALNQARSEGTTLAEVMRDLLDDYLADRPAAEDLKRAIKRLNAIQKRLQLAEGDI